ncbi:MAG: M6 family metalloprotease domain-containing protein, partial [candidate division Zixibacteria bacterium]|nr:M6 family metalloprotease domain-containing protein [candidate division Zixibacteria bacterium]
LTDGDPSIDFAQFDNDGPDGVPNSGDDDGVVDALIVTFPDGDASGGDSDNLWAHQWSLTYGSGSAFTTNDAKAGGGYILVDIYTIQSSEQGNGTLNQIKPIGVFCHEFGHVLGLPDLYDYDDSSYGIGTWCLMSSGSWGANWSSATEYRPTHICAWGKAMLGWVTPIEVSGTQAVQIAPAETNAQVYKLWDDAYQGTRFFLLENRTRTGFDADISGDGVLIWHCNEEVFFSNSDDSYRLVDLEEADGLAELDSKLDAMDAGDMFPGSTGNTSFADATNPPATDVFGSNTGSSATSFVAGPGSSVSVTLTQRGFDGYTVYHRSPNAQLLGWGLATSVVSYGALRLTADAAGDLVSVQAAVSAGNPVGYTVRVFDDMVGNSPSGLQTLASGSFPSFATDRYHEITLPTPVALASSETFLVDVGWGPDTYAVPFTRAGTISMNSYGSTDGVSYSQWSDKDVAIRARIQASPMSAGNDDNDLLPEDFSLAQNYPNPFNPNTEISFTLPSRAEVRLSVYNLLGQRVMDLARGEMPAGTHTVSWDGADESGNAVASGLYLYRLVADGMTMSKKMVLLK